MSAYIVTAPAVRAVAHGIANHVHCGAPLPDGVAEADIERLLGKGMIEAVESEPEVESEPDVESEPEVVPALKRTRATKSE